MKFNKPKVAIEVKWGRVSDRDVKKAEETLSKISSERKILFIPDKKIVGSSILEILDVDDL